MSHHPDDLRVWDVTPLRADRGRLYVISWVGLEPAALDTVPSEWLDPKAVA